MLLYNLACIYSLAGEAGSSLECLEGAIGRGFAHRDWIRRDSNLDLIRADPRYAAVMARLGG
jgi:hypothetical protein